MGPERDVGIEDYGPLVEGQLGVEGEHGQVDQTTSHRWKVPWIGEFEQISLSTGHRNNEGLPPESRSRNENRLDD